ncbi:MAG: hypothetical protein IT373_36160 [Polyangiaceae bacterium]|nr:hypothetical protein [Polyangiaceae bacterium]
MTRADKQKKTSEPALRRRRVPDRAPSPAPGLAVVTLELRSAASLRVRTLAGAVLPARLAPGFEPELADECLRDYRHVLAEIGADGEAVLLGALQTQRTTSRDAHDAVELRGRRVELRAEDEIRLCVGKSVLRMDKSGAVRVTGQKMTLDVAAVVRFLSALVELP